MKNWRFSAEESIDVSVASFSGGSTATEGGSDGIKLHPSNTVTGHREDRYRNEIELKLTNEDNSKNIDLGNFKTLDETQKQLATVDSGETNSIVLSGVAGTKESTDVGATGVDSKGANEEFNLVFSIKKH